MEKQCGGESVSQLALKDKGFRPFQTKTHSLSYGEIHSLPAKGQFPNLDLGGAPVRGSDAEITEMAVGNELYVG